MFVYPPSISDFLYNAKKTISAEFYSLLPVHVKLKEFCNNFHLVLLDPIESFCLISSIIFLIYFRQFIYDVVIPRILENVPFARNTCSRLKDSLWLVIIYSLLFRIDVYMSLKYNAFKDPSRIFHKYERSLIPLDLKIYRFIQIGFYFQELLNLMKIKHQSSDFLAMGIHHFFVIILQWVSYASGFVIAGTMIETMHDINDIFLHAAKIFNYMKEARTRHEKIYEIISGIFFFTFFGSWILTRIIMYMDFVVLPVIYKPFEYISINTPFTFIIFFILILILVLNSYWTLLIMRVLIKILRDPSKASDVRDDKNNTITEDESVKETIDKKVD